MQRKKRKEKQRRKLQDDVVKHEHRRKINTTKKQIVNELWWAICNAVYLRATALTLPVQASWKRRTHFDGPHKVIIFIINRNFCLLVTFFSSREKLRARRSLFGFFIRTCLESKVGEAVYCTIRLQRLTKVPRRRAGTIPGS